MSIKTKVKQLGLKMLYGYYDSVSYVNWLRNKGVTVGEGTCFYSPQHISIDVTRPYAVSIGNNVHITSGVKILTHGFDWSVLKGIHNDVVGSFGEVVIGDNVFIGSGATILKGCHIGDNVIVGVGSVVTKDLGSNAVYVGNPARRVCSIEEYYQKRIRVQTREATEQFLTYYCKYGKVPPKEELNEFFFLFENRKNKLHKRFKRQMNNNGNFELCEKLYLTGFRQQFENYEEFSKFCLKQISENIEEGN